MGYKQYNDYELIYMVRENDDDSQDILFQKYQPIVRKIAGEYFSHYSSYGYDYEDFVQEGNVAFQKSVMYYDEKKDSTFYTFVVLCIRRKLLSFCRKISSPKKNISQHEVLDIDDCVVADKSNDISDLCHYFEIEDICRKLLWELSLEKSSVFELRMNGFTYQEIGILLDLPTSTAEFQNRVIRRELKKRLQKYYFI